MIKYRAFYKHDLATGEILPFYVQEMDDDFKFVMEEPVPLEQAIAYPFCIPFLDDDWIVHRWTGFTDSAGVDIYEGDTVSFEYTTRSGSQEGVIKWNDKYKLLGIASEGHSGILPFFNFMTNDGKLLVWSLGYVKIP